jgi:hypothetical protein
VRKPSLTISKSSSVTVFCVGFRRFLLQLDHKIFERKVAETPLKQVEFQKSVISKSTVGCSIPMTPMFAPVTGSFSQSLAFDSTADQQSLGFGGGILATQVSQEDRSMDEDVYLEQQTLQANQTTVRVRRAARVPKSTPQQLSRGAGGFAMPSARNVKKRNQGSEGRAIAKQQEIRLDRTEARRKAEIAERRQIRFTREYRQGEVPDVEITYGEIVKKLQDIVLLDSGVARLTVGSMVASWDDAVFDDADVKSRLKNSLDALFEAVTDQTSSDMLETLLHVASAADIHIKPQHVVDASKKTNSFFIGIQALERQATLEQPEEQRKEKRTRNKGPGGRASAKQQFLNPNFSNSNWAALADLYAALEENDIALGLTSKFTKFEETQDALELELQGRQLEALEKWSSVFEKDILETEGQSWPEHTISGLIIESAISQRC